MMAAKHGAKVVACEMFPALASVAEEVISYNSLSSRIEVNSCKSVDFRLFEGQENGSERKENPKFDLLISELLDSALLGLA
jgi:hypothetical protein